MGFLELLAIFIVSMIVSILLRPKIKDKSSPGDFRPPEPREGEPIPVVFGTCLLSPSLTWFGDVTAKKINKEVSSMFGLVKDKVSLGYEYYAGMMMVLCHGPVDSMLDIYIGEKRVVRTAKYVGTGVAQAPATGWAAPSTPTLPEDYSDLPTRVSINLPKLFGGREEGGGIVGQMDVHWGSLIQGPNDYLAVFWGADLVPQYRKLCYVVLRRMYLGKSPQPQPWKFVLKRIPDVLGQSAYATITDEDDNEIANPAEVIYEILTNRVWGLGKDPASIDATSFSEAGQTLYSEGRGYSGTLVSKTEAWNALSYIQKHINAVIYQHPLTGLISIKLIRDDYNPAELVELTDSNCVIEEYTRGSWAETINETAVNYTDIGRRFSDGTAQAQNLAAIQAMDGEVISTSLDLAGLSTHQQAQLASEEANRVTSVPLVRMRIITNRVAYAFHPGKPFKVTYSEYDIDSMVCRVMSVNYGSLVDGLITIEALQDPWDLSALAYASPDALEDLAPCGPLELQLPDYDPSGDPAAYYGPGRVLLMEAPYWHVGAAGRVWAAMSRSQAQDLYWECYRSLHGTDTVKMASAFDFISIGIIEENIEQTGTGFTDLSITVKTLGDMDLLTSTDYAGMLAGERLLIIDEEIFAWELIVDLGDGRYRIDGVWRAVLDTVPDFHIQSSVAFFYYNSSGGNSASDLTAPDDLDAFTGVQIWPAIVDADGTSDPLELLEMSSLVVQERAIAPAPPGNVRVQGYGYDTWPDQTTGDVVLTWSHRSRTLQTQMVAQDDATDWTLEGTVTVQVIIAGNMVRETASINTGTFTYTYAQRQSDDANMSRKVEFNIIPVGSSGEEGIIRKTPPILMGA